MRSRPKLPVEPATAGKLLLSFAAGGAAVVFVRVVDVVFDAQSQARVDFAAKTKTAAAAAAAPLRSDRS